MLSVGRMVGLMALSAALGTLPIPHTSKLYIMHTSAGVNIKIHFLSVTTTIFCQSL